MLKQLQKNNNKGFTIIEVMIVLAIAGLIILIVLLAVPALQRNGRNTGIKSDASTIAAGISEYRSNNDGSNPTAVSSTAVTGGGTEAAIKIQSNTTVISGASPKIGEVGYVFGKACGNSTSNGRAASIYYQVETSGAATTKCIDA